MEDIKNTTTVDAEASIDPENPTTPTSEETTAGTESPRPRKKICLGGIIEQACMTVMAIGVVVIAIFDAQWLKYSVAVVCAIVFLIPIVLRVVRNHNRLSPEKVCDILRKRGLSPIITEDGIRWVCNGKESVLRIRSHCQVEIAREYDLPPIPAAIEGNEKAALETMKEVYLAKVSVRTNDGCNRLFFSTESLCVSAKELNTYLPMCIEILDLAESRQKEHISEIRNAGTSTSKRIGYMHPDGEIR